MNNLWAGLIQGIGQGMMVAQERKRQQELDKIAKQMTEMKMKELGMDLKAKESFLQVLAQTMVGFPAAAGPEQSVSPAPTASMGQEAVQGYPTFPLNGPQPSGVSPAPTATAPAGPPGGRLLDILSRPDMLMMAAQAYPQLIPAIQAMYKGAMFPLQMQQAQLGVKKGELDIQSAQQAIAAQQRKDEIERRMAAGEFPQLPMGGSVNAGAYNYSPPMPQRIEQTGPLGERRHIWVTPGGQSFGAQAQPPAIPPMSYESITPDQGARPEFWADIYRSMSAAGDEPPITVGQEATKWRDDKGNHPPANAPKRWVEQNYEPYVKPTKEEQSVQNKAKQAIYNFNIVQEHLFTADGKVDMAKINEFWDPKTQIYTLLRSEGGPIDNFALFAGYLNSGAEVPAQEKEAIKNIFFPNNWDVARAKLLDPATVQEMITNKLMSAKLFAQGAVDLELLPPEERKQLEGLMTEWEKRSISSGGGTPAPTPTPAPTGGREIPYEQIWGR